MTIQLFYGVAVVSGGAYLALRAARKHTMARVAAGVYTLAILGAIWGGWDFSPSFTMLFTALGATVYTVGLVLWCGLEHKVQGKKGCMAWLRLPLAVGMLLSLPGVCIYAAGDDWMQGCLWGSVIAGTVCVWVRGKLLSRALGPMGVSQGVELWISMGCVWFALLCGVPSVALLPYAAGMLALVVGRQISVHHGNWGNAVFGAGLALISLFSCLPALC